mmetsp:Transcript_6904/g.9221  ORF Transcript_6904/g.9221 Transcript_6904/m.9221 type:complete len:103 (+) Transcript_6904:186-494(+)
MHQQVQVAVTLFLKMPLTNPQGGWRGAKETDNGERERREVKTRKTKLNDVCMRNRTGPFYLPTRTLRDAAYSRFSPQFLGGGSFSSLFCSFVATRVRATAKT